MILPLSSLPLSSRHRVSQISFHPTQAYLAVQSHDRSVEIFRVRTAEEIQKKQIRKKKRIKQKRTQAKDKDDDLQSDEDLGAHADDNVNLLDRFTPHLVIRATGKIRSFDFATSESASRGNVHVSSDRLPVKLNSAEL